MSDLNYNIKISSAVEIRALRELEASLQKQIVQAKLLGKSIKEIGKLQGQLAATRSSLKDFGFGQKIGSEILGFAEKVPVLGEAMSALNGTLGAASAGLGAFALVMGGAKKAVEEFAAAEKEVAKLDAALAQTGYLTEEYRARLQALAQELQDTTGVASEEWIGVLKRLTQFGSTPESIGMDVEAVKNLAGVVGDVTTAANLYSRALAGNFDVFGRYGIKVTEGATNLQKLAEIQEQAKRGMGQLEAQGNSLSGGWDKLKNSTADVWKEIGRLLAGTGVLQSALGGLGYAAKWWADVFGGTIPQVDGLQNSVAGLVPTLAQAQQASADLAESQAKIKKAADDNVEAIDKEIKKLKEQQQQADRMTDAKMAEKLAALDEEKAKRGPGMSEVEYTSRQNKIRREAAEEKYRNEQTSLQRQAEKETEKLNVPKQKVDEFKDAVGGQEERLNFANAKANEAAAKAKFDRINKSYEEALAEQQRAMDVVADLPYDADAGLKASYEKDVADAKNKAALLRRQKHAARDELTAAHAATTAAQGDLDPKTVGTVAEETLKLDALNKQLTDWKAKLAALIITVGDVVDEVQQKIKDNEAIRKVDRSTEQHKDATTVIKADETDKERAEKQAADALKKIQQDNKYKGAGAATPPTSPDAPTKELADVGADQSNYHEAVKAGIGALGETIQKNTDDLYAYVDQVKADLANG